MSIIINAKLVNLLSNLVKKKEEIIFFDDIPAIEELIYLKPEAPILWVTSHGRLQQLIVMEDGPTSITLISKDLEGGDIWSLCLPKEDGQNDEVHRVMFYDVAHDFTSSEEYSSSSDDYEEDEDDYGYEPSPEEVAQAIAERYGVSQEDDE